MTTAAELGAGSVGAAGKPIFLAADPALYVAKEKETLTDRERLEWKSYKLWHTTRAMERRDNAYEAAVNFNSYSSDLKQQLLGTPYPIIETNPTVLDGLYAMRPYEHAVSLLVAFAYSQWLRAKYPPRYHSLHITARRIFVLQTFALLEITLYGRSIGRLCGQRENDHECRKYGVIEDATRLQRKKELWDRYAAYKREWGRRYDYHIFGMRPGEHRRLLSPCWLPMWTPSYCTKTDYPARKNPYFVSSKPLRPMQMDAPYYMRIPADDRVPIVQQRPELKYLYHGPRDAERGPVGKSYSCAG